MSAAGLRVGGLAPFTSIDYPGKLSAVVFVQGCPWRCGYCHNPHLQARGAATGPAWAETLAWLQRRVGLLDAVVFSGGEPTIDPALGAAMDEARALGLAIGLHSGGIHPRRLREVLPRADWIGLDVKAPLDDDTLHDRITGVAGSAAAAREGLDAVLDANIAHEARSTVHPALFDEAALLRLAEGLARRGVKRYAVQIARPAGALRAVAPPGWPSAGTLGRLGAMFEGFELRGG
ncbi:anaerobic ribonucleoside-triphosphate reductase activating protein [Piscinibacter sp.]|uniref:anaerobic ribonucleoside-triphosphate reductase activating protein n=1 Tax=Piscinibacter sp. TaxID=1903157 RepID=UPI0039E4D333